MAKAQPIRPTRKLPCRPEAVGVVAGGGAVTQLDGDTFDRTLARQGMIEQATFLTRDAAAAAYGPVVAW